MGLNLTLGYAGQVSLAQAAFMGIGAYTTGLLMTAGLHWREVDVLRGYAGYAFQVGVVPSRLALPTALVQQPVAGCRVSARGALGLGRRLAR